MKVGNRLQKGGMRGKRCHITVHFTDKKVSETKSFDDCIGVTTVKDIYEEDDRMEPSLIKILENVAGVLLIMKITQINKKMVSMIMWMVYKSM